MQIRLLNHLHNRCLNHLVCHLVWKEVLHHLALKMKILVSTQTPDHSQGLKEVHNPGVLKGPWHKVLVLKGLMHIEKIHRHEKVHMDLLKDNLAE